MPSVNSNLESKKTAWQTFTLKMPIALAAFLSLAGPAYSAGPIQPVSCEHPPAQQPQVPYPPNLTDTPINAPAFPPPDSLPAPVGPGQPVQPPSCVQPPVPPIPVPYPPALSQTPVNAPSFPPQPVQPYTPVNYGSIPYNSNVATTVPGAGNSPGIGVPGNALYGFPGTTTLLNPLVPGASFAYPGMPAPLGLLPAIGSGYVPLPVNPGMLGLPLTPIPWTNGTAGNSPSQITNQAVIPANQIDQPNNTVSMPYSNLTAQPPGSWKTSVPPGPSTPGADPGILRKPGFNAGAWAGQYVSPATTVSLPDNGQLPNSAPTARSKQRGSTSDFGLSQSTPTPKEFWGYHMQISQGQNNEPIFNGWKGLAGSTVQDFGQGVRQLKATGQLKGNAATFPPQTSFDAARPAEYPGGQSNTGTLTSSSPGNHGHNSSPALFADAQVTNDLYGTPMINPSKIFSDGSGNTVSGTPLTTIAPY